MNDFWKFFEEIEPKLGFRNVSFRKIFEYLDKFETPVTIIETGCVRQAENWAGDGGSTILFDKYVTWRGDGSHVYSVDINNTAVELCRSQVSKNVTVTVSDSVSYLNLIADNFIENNIQITLLYLDSYDVDWAYCEPSAIHHLKELAVAQRFINQDTLVVVDDCGMTGIIIPNDKDPVEYGILLDWAKIGGKGKLLAEFANHLGITTYFSHYQAGWIGFGNKVI